MPVFDHHINALSDIVVHRWICDFATADRLIGDQLTALLGRHYQAATMLRHWQWLRPQSPDHFNALGATLTIRNGRLTAADLEAAILQPGPDAVTAVQRRLMPAEPLRYPQRVIIAFTGPCDEPGAP